MNRQATTITALLLLGLAAYSSSATAEIAGITGSDCLGGGTSACFSLTARSGNITLGDGNSLLAWGYGESSASTMQYPGPTLIVEQGATVQVTLSNTLDEPVSIIFPGQSGVSASGGSAGVLTNEIEAGAGTVVYQFVASEPGTYLYQSGTNMELQVEMGLVGALIVRPSAGAGTAYGTASTAFDHEYLFFQTDMDRSAHEAVAQGLPVDPARFSATLWFINGRNGPDTMHPDNVGWLPLQPYGALARTTPGDRVLMRLVGAGLDMHPFHHHGNNAWIIAKDGRPYESAPGASELYPDFQGKPAFQGPGGNMIPALTPAPGLDSTATLPDEAVSNYTILTEPGTTYDAIWTWTGMGMNWDIYGNQPGHTLADCAPYPVAGYETEDESSHCKDLEGASGRLVLPEQQALTFGGLWSGSPYMGVVGSLPPDQGGLNPNGGFSFMWHSHTERELTNDDIFPGGMMTMMIVEAPGTAF